MPLPQLTVVPLDVTEEDMPEFTKPGMMLGEPQVSRTTKVVVSTSVVLGGGDIIPYPLMSVSLHI
jgi:hypothetical protein